MFYLVICCVFSTIALQPGHNLQCWSKYNDVDLSAFVLSSNVIDTYDLVPKYFYILHIKLMHSGHKIRYLYGSLSCVISVFDISIYKLESYGIPQSERTIRNTITWYSRFHDFPIFPLTMLF